ncbi:neuropeptide Y receptor type 2 [Caerostris extrusa]|uniref:Neuropeptide Y receptor type 2 n=1 Tax=Caerostris extrusa TaxID=172846 RepID=A0AAV4RGQ7_CAEEX|nr:neuropeptide Y receptor type 2 [Caerostris extrusa]
MELIPTENGLYCDEVWPHESSRRAFGFSTSILQFVVPFIIITFCYMKVCIKLKIVPSPSQEPNLLRRKKWNEKEPVEPTECSLPWSSSLELPGYQSISTI